MESVQQANKYPSQADARSAQSLYRESVEAERTQAKSKRAKRRSRVYFLELHTPLPSFTSILFADKSIIFLLQCAHEVLGRASGSAHMTVRIRFTTVIISTKRAAKVVPEASSRELL